MPGIAATWWRRLASGVPAERRASKATIRSSGPISFPFLIPELPRRGRNIQICIGQFSDRVNMPGR